MTTEATLCDQVLLPCEAAELLQITEEELLSAARSGEVHGVCLGSVWRFARSTVLEFKRQAGL
ncbi:helix-turn-helix domain-containing protein [Saccharopolyspora sp. NPDC049357]|uniref:helix-turn-helix domain-containing protein n=1 Tax=Saccharopolyspora sp. NPDC049357 TaxID=3154507 RepID=UPI00342B820E